MQLVLFRKVHAGSKSCDDFFFDPSSAIRNFAFVDGRFRRNLATDERFRQKMEAASKIAKNAKTTGREYETFILTILISIYNRLRNFLPVRSEETRETISIL